MDENTPENTPEKTPTFTKMADAVEWIVSLVSDRDRAVIRSRAADAGADVVYRDPVDRIAGEAHHGFGTYVRNELQLWHPPAADLREDIWNSLTEEKRDYYAKWWKGDYQGRTMHADDASHTLMIAAVRKIIAS